MQKRIVSLALLTLWLVTMMALIFSRAITSTGKAPGFRISNVALFQISVLSPQNKTYYSTFVPLTFKLDRPAQWIGYSVDQQENVTITGNCTIQVASSGKHQLVIYARDELGNEGVSEPVCFAVDPVLYFPWKTSFIGLDGRAIVDFAIYNGRLHAASDTNLYVFDGISWGIIRLPTCASSLHSYIDKLAIGGKGGLYTYDGRAFTLVFSVPTYIKPLGIYNNALFAGTFLDKCPVLYYCNGSVGNPLNWHTDTGFSSVLKPSDLASSIDSFAVYNNSLYITCGGTIYSYNGINWNIVKTYDDVYAFLDAATYNGKLYFATRDQAWRKPAFQGYSGFNGRLIEFDGGNWTTIIDHNYWIFSLETCVDKLYVGTANKIFIFDRTNWGTSFNAAEGAYYATSIMAFDDGVYVGMGNGHVLVFTYLTKESFENGFDGWVADSDVPSDPKNPSQPVAWHVKRATNVFHSGQYSVELFIDGSSDDGTIWIERRIGVKRNSQVEIQVSFWFYSEFAGDANVIAGVCAYAGTLDPEYEVDLTYLENAGAVAGWRILIYTATINTGSSEEAWIGLGISVYWESPIITHYIDDVSINIKYC